MTDFVCEAYPPEAAGYGVLCFFADRGTRNCATQEERAASVAGARKLLFQRMNELAAHEPQCPDCPLCGEPPYMVMGGGTQAFCGNGEGCPVMTWNPMESREHFLRTARQIEISSPGQTFPASDTPGPDGGTG